MNNDEKQKNEFVDLRNLLGVCLKKISRANQNRISGPYRSNDVSFKLIEQYDPEYANSNMHIPARACRQAGYYFEAADKNLYLLEIKYSLTRCVGGDFNQQALIAYNKYKSDSPFKVIVTTDGEKGTLEGDSWVFDMLPHIEKYFAEHSTISYA